MLDRRPGERTSWVVHAEMFDDQGAIVAVDGELDLATAHQLDRVVDEMIRYGHRHLVIDLTDAAFLDSVAMQTLADAITPLRDDADAAVVLAGAHGVVERSLTVSGIGQMFTMYETRDAAIGGVSHDVESLSHGWRRLRPRPHASP
jgi:anti-anti-sigma factor